MLGESRNKKCRTVEGDNATDITKQRNWRRIATQNEIAYIHERQIEQLEKQKILHTAQQGSIQASSTARITQEEILKDCNIQTKVKAVCLDLEHGPYIQRYSNNGGHALIAGARGHLAAFDSKCAKLLLELHLEQSLHDATFLHNSTLLAVAQSKRIFIYNNSGLEVHCIKAIKRAKRLCFLPYHFLLVSATSSGRINWIDVSTGEIVASRKTSINQKPEIAHSTSNGVILLGTNRGYVEHWIPSLEQPALAFPAHNGKIQALAVSPCGQIILTSGCEAKTKLWDVRKLQDPLSIFNGTNFVSCADFSGTTMCALASHSKVTIWKDIYTAPSVYLQVRSPSPISSLSFCPFEDILGIGHGGGIQSAVVPGAGIANFDSSAANFFETKKQRQNREVVQLMEKLPPESINLQADFIGTLQEAKAPEQPQGKAKVRQRIVDENYLLSRFVKTD